MKTTHEKPLIVQTGKFTNNDIKRKDIRSDYRIESIADLETLLLKLG